MTLRILRKDKEQIYSYETDEQTRGRQKSRHTAQVR